MLRFFSQIHVSVYRLSDGRRRNRVNQLPVMLLTTKGRRSGKSHTIPIVYLTHKDAFLVAPGYVPRPDWYLNLKKSRRAEIQIGGRRFLVEAEEISGPERERLWETVPEYWKEYERRAGITMPLILLHPR